jgi:hypothetical protein
LDFPALFHVVNTFGLPTVAIGVGLYILLKGELTFRYPAKPNGKRGGA